MATISRVGVASVNGGASNSAVVTTALPAGVAAGDFLALFVYDGTDPVTVPTPSGWNFLRRDADPGTAPAESAITIFWKIAGGSETAPTINVGTSTRWHTAIAAYRNVDPINPFVAQNAKAETASVSTHAAATLTNTDAGAWGVYAMTARQVASPYTATPGPGLTELVDIESGNAGLTNVIGYLADSAGPVAVGDVTYNATASGASTIAMTWAGLLRPGSPAADTTAPSVPAGVTATAVDPTTVTVSWTASTDNVGVASYRVRRNGTNLSAALTVGGTSFTDTTASPSTAYTYTVSAVDVAGNRSSESAPASVTTPAPPTITQVGSRGAIGPDSGNSVTHVNPAGIAVGDVLVAQVHTGATTATVATPTGWTKVLGPVEDAQVPDGVHYLFVRVVDGTANDAPSWTSSANASIGYLVVAVRGASTVSPIHMADSVTGLGSPVPAIPMTTTLDECFVVNFVADRKNAVDAPPRYSPVGSGWTNDLDLGVGPATPTGSLSIHTAVRRQTTAGSVPPLTWTQSSSTNGYVAFQVAISPPFTDSTVPSTPTGLTAVADTSSQVSLSWSPSTDNVGVASYRVRRNGVDLPGATAVAGTSWVDSTVSASTAYTYTVSAVDAAGNRSAESTSASATTPAPSPTLLSRWVGAVTPTQATVVVRTATASSVRLKVGTNPAVTSGVIFGNPVVPDSNGMSKPTVSGLTAGSLYYYALELDGVLATQVGQFRTFPTGQASFSFAFGSCTNTPDSDSFARIRARNPLLFIHLGDLRYKNIGTNNPALFRAMFDEVLASPMEADLYANVPTAYTWSDHDYGPADSNGTSAAKPAAQSTYRQYVPHYPLPAADGGIYQTFVVGRVRFILTDNRSYKSIQSVTDDAGKTMLGAAQKQWFKDVIASATEPLIIWGSENVWTWPTEAGADSWAGYDTERQELASFIVAAKKRVVVISGDTHQLGADDGTNGAGGIPNLLSSPLENSTASKGGPWSQGTYRETGGTRARYYAMVDVTDTGDQIGVTYTGYDKADTARVLLTKTWTLAAPSLDLLRVGAGPVTLRVGANLVDKAFVGSVQIYP